MQVNTITVDKTIWVICQVPNTFHVVSAKIIELGSGHDKIFMFTEKLAKI